MMSQLRLIFTLVSVLAITSWMTYGFHFNAPLQRSILQKSHSSEYRHNVNSNAGVSSAVYAMQQKKTRTSLQMNFFSDAARFLTNLNKEASAKHILMTGPEASRKLTILKEELRDSKDISAAFSELAAKVSECPSASRGGNLGTFKPGMMVREIDRICFEKEVNVVHGPVETQFGSHLILVTRRYEGEKDKK